MPGCPFTLSTGAQTPWTLPGTRRAADRRAALHSQLCGRTPAHGSLLQGSQRHPDACCPPLGAGHGRVRSGCNPDSPPPGLVSLSTECLKILQVPFLAGMGKGWLPEGARRRRDQGPEGDVSSAGPASRLLPQASPRRTRSWRRRRDAGFPGPFYSATLFPFLRPLSISTHPLHVCCCHQRCAVPCSILGSLHAAVLNTCRGSISEARAALSGDQHFVNLFSTHSGSRGLKPLADQYLTNLGCQLRSPIPTASRSCSRAPETAPSHRSRGRAPKAVGPCWAPETPRPARLPSLSSQGWRVCPPGNRTHVRSA